MHNLEFKISDELVVIHTQSYFSLQAFIMMLDEVPNDCGHIGIKRSTGVFSIHLSSFKLEW